MQAAIGVAQLRKLPGFYEERTKFFPIDESMHEILSVSYPPYNTEGRFPRWFGFPLTVRNDAPFTRADIVSFLEQHGIATRSLRGATS